MGIPTARVKITCFMLCSMLVGLRRHDPGAAARLAAALDRRGAGAAGRGGGRHRRRVALLAASARSLGGIIGTTLIRVIDNGLVLSQVDANWFKFAIGVLTIFAVVANAWMRRRARSHQDGGVEQ